MAATYGEGVYGNGVGVTTPLSHKMAQITEFTKTTTANLIRPGVLYNGNASLVTGRANMAYDVAPFSIVTTRGATSGAVKWANDGTVTVSTTAAPGSNSRIDVIYAWHREFSIDGVDSNPVIGVVQGTAAASPTVPSLAAFPGAIELARVTVPAGVTATNSGTTFTQTAPFTSTDGGTVAFRTKTEMDLWTTALPDQLARDLSTGTVYVRMGSAWVERFGDTGWTALTLGSSWVNYGAPYTVARYRRLNGVVYVEGLIRNGSVTSGAVIGTLPAGFRPAAQKLFPVIANLNVAASIEVLATGAIAIASVSGSSSLTLETIRFIAEA